jgi:hypothetical protein
MAAPSRHWPFVVCWIVETGVKWAVGWLIGEILKVKLGG